MSNSTPVPDEVGPPTRIYCNDCRGYHGDHVAGMAALRAAEREGIARAAHRRTRVLAYPDIAARLTQPPLRFTVPEMWEGHVPPAWLPTKEGWKPNTSPARTALIDICKAVAEREEQQEGDAA